MLVENGPGPASLDTVVSRLETTPGIAGAVRTARVAQGQHRAGRGVPAHDGAAKPVRQTISDLQNDVLPALEPRSASTSS